MSAVITDQFRVYNAKEFVSRAATDNLYMFFSKTLNGPNTFGPAPLPLNAITDYFYPSWKNMLAGKKIPFDFLTHVILRNLWTIQTEYDVYDISDENLRFTNSIVITEDFNVYVCIDKPVGGVSTVKPVGTSPNVTVFSSSDRYRWKFLYQLDPVRTNRFFTPFYIPVKNVTTPPSVGSVDSLQFDVQQAANQGEILSIRVLTAGSGYTSVPTVVVNGDGTGLQATAVVSGNAISHIVVTSYGYGYTECSITLSGGGGSGATLSPVMSPIGGFGKDMVATCVANNVLVVADFEGNENMDLHILNDFSEVGMLKNPKSFGTSSNFTQETFRQTYVFNLSGVNGDIVRDQIITQATTGAVGHVVDYDSDNEIIAVSGVNGIKFELGLIESTTPFLNAIVEVITNPELEPFSSDVLFLDKREAITRSADQTEKIRLVLEF